MLRVRSFAAVTVVCGLIAGCSSSGSSGVTSSTTTNTASAPTTVEATTVPAPTTTEPATTTVAPTTTVPDTPAIAAYRATVEFLASDALEGRDNNTLGSDAAQKYLVAELSKFAQPLVQGVSGDEAFKQHFALGANLLAVIPGSDLAQQYVMVGAHYDHLGKSGQCNNDATDDKICNGATDNATGVAAALAVGRAIAAGPKPRRSVIIALWDAEEDGLAGSAGYVANPVVPLKRIVGYVNFDIQGSNLLPHLRGSTVMVGAETGGPHLVAAAIKATKASSLFTISLSLLFGQGRSDHANFAAAGVPSVFFTDATGACYHTVHDDASVVDYAKLDQQVATAEALTRDLMNTNALPVYNPKAPAATYDDAVSMLYTVSHAEPDFGRFSPKDKAASEAFLTALHTIVDAGASKFTPDSVGVLLSGAIGYVSALATGKCEGFLTDAP